MKILSRAMPLLRHKIIRNVILVAGGTAAAQLLTVMVSPILTRLYAPAELGSLNIFTSLILVLSTLSGLAYSYAIPLPKEDAKAAVLLHISVKLGMISSLAIGAIFILLANPIATTFKLESAAAFFWMIPLVTFFVGCRDTFFQWLIRKKQFKTIASITLSQSIFMNALFVCAGFIRPEAISLIVALSLSHFFGVFLLSRKIIIDSSISVMGLKPGSSKEVRKVAIEYSDFPRYRAPQIFINTISHSLPTLAFAALFSPAITGLYALGAQVLRLPATLISKSLGQVILPELAGLANDGKQLKSKVVKSTMALIGVGIVPFSLVFLFGPEIFSLVFGKNWILAGKFSSWLSLQMFMGFVNVPAVQAIAITRNQRFLLIWEISTTLIKFGVILFGAWYLKNDVLTVAAFSIFGALAYFVLILESVRRAGNIGEKQQEEKNPADKIQDISNE